MDLFAARPAREIHQAFRVELSARLGLVWRLQKARALNVNVLCELLVQLDTAGLNHLRPSCYIVRNHARKTLRRGMHGLRTASA